MAKRYYAYNTLARCIRSSSNPVDGDNQSGHYNSTYVSNGIGNDNNGDYFGVKQPFDDGSVAITGFASFRFDTWQSWTTSRAILYLVNGALQAYQVVRTATGTCQVQYWNTVTAAWVVWGTVSGLTQFLNQTHVLNIDLTAGTFSYYVDNILKASDGGTPPVNAATSITEVRHYSTASGSTVCTWSQLMAADFDLRDFHMYSKLASAEGFYTNGVGTAADVDEAVLNDGDAIGLTAVGQKHTCTHGAFAALPAGLIIGGMSVNGRLRTGGTVSDGQFKIRNGGVDANSADVSADTAYAGRGAFFGVDPATGTAFASIAAANSTEIGLEAV